MCPFTSEIAQQNENLLDLFRDFPNLIVCGELLEPNPYNHISDLYSPKSHILVFDIFQARSDFQLDLLLPLQRQELLEKYSIKTVTVFGEKSIADFEELCHILNQLNR
ncbi:MAG: RNA ligase family protein [Candidatus Hodarchaeota archaeon]